MALIDTHTHLYSSEFDIDRQDVVQNALNSGVVKMLLPNIDSGSVDGMMELCSDYPGVFHPMIGLHPGSVKENYAEELSIIENLAYSKEFVAIGEIGIDLYWDKNYFPQQREAFEKQIMLAIELDLPIVIHARNSFTEIFNILDKHTGAGLKGVFHSFTGGLEELKKIQEYDFYLGINGIVTFKNSNLVNTVKEIPMNRILLETDSPYLSPAPKRGKRNESSYLNFINDFLAGILLISPEEMAEISSENAIKLFKLK